MLFVRKEAQVLDRQIDDDAHEGMGRLAATIMALLVLVAIVVLFLVLKFQPFSGTTGNQIQGSL